MHCEAACHNLTPAGIENMYPPSADKKHRDWINELMSTPGGPHDAVDQLILAAFECAVSILDETAATAQSGESLETAGLSSSSASAPRTVLGVEAPPGLLAIEDIKPDEYYQAADQIRGALQNLPEQIQQQEESRTANWIHTTEPYPDNLWTDYEYAGARINFVIRSLESGPEHPDAQSYTKVPLPGRLPYLDDYIIRLWRTFIGPWMTIGAQSLSRRSLLKVTCRICCFLQKEMSSTGSGQKQLAR